MERNVNKAVGTLSGKKTVPSAGLLVKKAR